jgi:hypothetical protein
MASHATFLRMAAIIGALFAAISCAKDDGDSGGGGGVFSNLGWDGSWHGTCVTEGEDFGQARLQFSGAQATRTFGWYATADCRDGDEYVAYASSFKNARSLSPSDLEGFTTIKATVASHTATPMTTAQAEFWSEKKKFGYDDWESSVAKDISGRKFDEADAYGYSEVGSEIYRTLTEEDSKIVFAIYKDGVALRSDDPYDVFERD